MNTKIFFTLLSLCTLLCYTAQAQFSQPGELDTTFNFGRPHSFFTDPANPWPGEGANGNIRSLALQPNGRVLIGGGFTNYNGISRNGIARLNADGSLDASFNPGIGANSWVNSLALQPDGKVLIGGEFTNYNGISRNRIARLNADGSLDANFNPGTGVEGSFSSVESLALQSDGKVLIGGDFTDYNGISRNGIARLNADGSLDATFNPGTGADNTIQSLALQPDGKVLIGGDFTNYNGTPRNRIARMNADGSLDATFNPGTGVGGGSFPTVLSLALQPDGKVLIGGEFTSNNGTPRNRIARLNADGSLDASFNPGTGVNAAVADISLQPDGKVLIGGFFSTYNGTSRNNIARLNIDGSLDASFNPGTGADNTIRSLALQHDGKVLIGGWFSSYNGTSRNYIAGLNADGSLDANFNPGPGIGANSSVRSLALQPDDKVLIGGRFTDYNGTSRNRIAGLNADGSLDAGFNPGTGANDWVNSLVLQPDGKVLIGGQFFSYNGTPRKRIARLNADGSLDVGFNPGTGANNGGVESLALQPDGKVLIGGRFTDYNGTSRNRIARLNADGSLDAGFNPGTGANDEVIAFALQPDGKVLIGGRFTNYNGTPRNRIARLNADGSLDAGFNPGTGADLDVVALSLQPDGKVLIGGDFNNYNGTSRNKIARLNADGSLDASFNPVIGANNTIRSFALQPDGKVLIGGSFTTYNGTPRNRIARLNADGSLDDSFNPGTGANDWVNSLALQPDGKVLIGGWFTSYNGTYRPRIARVFANSNSSLPVSITRLAARQQQGNVAVEWTVAAETGVKHYEVEHSTNGHDFGKTGVVRARNSGAATYSFIHQQPGSGNHYYRLRSEDIDGKSQLTQVVKVTLGSSQKGFGVYPTLVSGNRLTIELNGLGKGRYTLQLNDMAGKMLMNSAIQHDGGSATQNLQLPAGLAAGTYLIRLQGEGSSYSQKIVKE